MFAYVQDTSTGGRIIVETQSSADTGTHDMFLNQSIYLSLILIFFDSANLI